MTSQDGEDRIIDPHALFYSGVRWHVRAYCEKHRDYRDFVISRIKSINDVLGKSIQDSSQDTNWYNYVEVNIMPNPNFQLTTSVTMRCKITV